MKLKILKSSNGKLHKNELHWVSAIGFVVFWFILYWSIAVTQINHLPKSLKYDDGWMKPDQFIAERALKILYNMTSLGPRVVGSKVNEMDVIDFLINKIQEVQKQANPEIEIEWNIQEASGSYIHWTMLNMYQSIQNVIVKLKCKNSISDNYVLINSHYDSVPGSPGAGDDGCMVVVMLEVMRILAISTENFKHPIIFLFNGAEENPLQASHAFITQHNWAKNCKCVINLDSAGNGGRELLFQSGPEHPWLMNYYRQVPHPFGNTVAEEMFQAGLIPSDTDFRIFRDYGQIPGTYTCCIGIRSAFIFMIAVFFQMLAFMIHLIIEKWSHNDNYFVIIQISSQIVPFVYYTSIGHLFYATLIPMTGRSGSNHNPDIFISGIAICCTILFAGFIMPIFLLVRRTCTIISIFLLFNWIFIFISMTSIGFPYRNETSSQRLHFMHAQRIMYNMDKSVRFEESGVYVYPQDRHVDMLSEYFDFLGESHYLNAEYCTANMFCGMPLFNHRWHNAREQTFWIPIKEKPILPGLMPHFKLTSTKYFTNVNKTIKRYTFNLMGPDHMTIFVGVKNNAQIVDWTFNKDLLNVNWPPPYFIYFTYGKRNKTLTFSIDVEIMADALNKATLEIGIGGHWLNQNFTRSPNLGKFINNLPKWISVTDWVATYENWLF